MNQILKLLSTISAVAVIIFTNTSYANEQKATDQYIYFGIGGGLSTPAIKAFDHLSSETNSKTRISLGSSYMLEGQVGYSFYPNMIAELSYTHQPKYTMSYVLPSVDLQLPYNGVFVPFNIPKTPGKTKVLPNIISLNLIYELSPMVAEIRPFVMFGAGMAIVDMKATSSYAKIPSAPDLEYFRVKRNKENYFAWRAGFGVTKDITKNINLDLTAKIQVVNNLKIKYDTFDLKTGKFVSQKPIKKTIGVGEFTMSLNYILPI